jgi:hypothetical protein
MAAIIRGVSAENVWAIGDKGLLPERLQQWRRKNQNGALVVQRRLDARDDVIQSRADLRAWAMQALLACCDGREPQRASWASSWAR